MPKKRDKIEELEEAVAAYEGVQQGDALFVDADKLRRDLDKAKEEREVIRRATRKNAMYWGTAFLLLTTASIYLSARSKDDKKTEDKPAAGAKENPGNAATEGAKEQDAVPEKKSFKQDLDGRVIDLLKKYLSRAEVVTSSAEIRKNPDDDLVENVVVNWEKALELNKASISAMHDFFSKGAVPRMVEFSATLSNLLEPEQFFVAKLGQVVEDDNPKRLWLFRHWVPYYNKESKTLFVSGSFKSTDDIELGTFAIKDLAREKGKELEGTFNKTVEKKFMEDIADGKFSNAQQLIDEIVRYEAANKQYANMPLIEKNARIERAVYLLVRCYAEGNVVKFGSKESRFDSVKPFLQEVIENPQAYINIPNDSDLAALQLESEFTSRRYAVIKRSVGEDQAKSVVQQEQNDQKFMEFLRAAVVPTAKDLKLKASSAYETYLADFFRKGAVIVRGADADKAYPLAENEFSVSDLAEEKNDSRHLWMQKHKIPYCEGRHLYLPKSLLGDDVSSIQLCLRDLDTEGGKKNLSFGEILADKSVLSKLADKGLTPMQFAIRVVATFKTRCSKLVKQSMGMGKFRASSDEKKRILLETELYKMILVTMRDDTPAIVEIRPLFKPILEDPHFYLTISPEEAKKLFISP